MRSDCPPPHCPIIGRLADICCTPRGTDDSSRAFRSSGIPALLASPSSCAGATDTASTSVVIASEGRIGGTSGQPSSDDHAGAAGLPAVGRQTHLVDHLIIVALSGAHLYPCHPRRPVLTSCHGGRVCCFDRQQHLGSCPSSCWLQRCHQQVDL
jgi:hypothetical protein